MKDTIKKFLEGHDVHSMNSERFQKDNHSLDNRVVFHLDALIAGYGWRDVRSLIGYSEHPVFREDKGYGLMFESNDGYEFWCHGVDDESMLYGLDSL